jgi:hypothetical protein
VDVAVAGAGNVSFTTDSSSDTGLQQNQASNGTYTLPANSSRGTITPVNGGQPEIFYMVSSTEFISLFSTDANATLEDFQQ